MQQEAICTTSVPKSRTVLTRIKQIASHSGASFAADVYHPIRTVTSKSLLLFMNMLFDMH